MRLRRFARCTLLGLGLGLAAHAQAPATSPYRIVIQEIDSTNFPKIELKFQVFLQDIDAQPWDVSQPIVIQEYIESNLADAVDMEEPYLCETSPVMMGVAIDVSGSVAGVMNEIIEGVQQLFQEMQDFTQQNPGAKKDLGAVYAFSSSQNGRYPDPSAPEGYTDQLQDLQQVVQDIRGGGASPIWVNMDKELTELLGYLPTDKDYKRVLATLTDGNNNVDEGAIDSLLTNAQRGGAQLFNLAYGSPNSPPLQGIADASGGAYMPGAEDNITKALTSLLASVRNTYCVRYSSPFGDRVNEPNTVTIDSGGTRDQAAYPLPFLIPEDTKNTTLFFPLTRWRYELLAAGDPNNLPGVKASMVLRTADASPVRWEPESPDHPDRSYKSYEVAPGETRWVADTGADRYGFEIPIPEEVLSIPTDFVDIITPPAPGEQLISMVQHYIVTAELVYSVDPTTGDTAQAGRQYPSATRLSVQDRTPPHVYARFRPQDGGPGLELQVREAGTFNMDTQLVDGTGLDDAAARQTGFGAKRARADYQWRDATGAAVEDQAEDQLWSDRDQFDPVQVLPGTLPGEVSQVGITVPEQQRMAIEVLARDNFAVVGESTAEEDRYVWEIDQTGERTGVPLHAEFDRLRPEAQRDSIAAPFLPIVSRADLEGDRARAGVAWWVEKHYNDPDPSPYDDVESLPVLAFQQSDLDVLKMLQREGLTLPPAGEPVRTFNIRAQDGQGNVTRLRLPLVVGNTRFDPRLVEWRRARAQDRE